jgi:4'-phosphopantetheinyl transferase
VNKRIFNPDKQNFALSEGEIQVWIVDLDKISSENNKMKEVLSEDELVRASKFHFKKDERRFIGSRSLIRILLSIYTGNSSKQIKFSYNQFGKPELIEEQNQKKINFNLSHSQNMLCIAFTKNDMIGADCEIIKPIKDYLEIAERHFSVNEVEQLKSFPTRKHFEGFYTIWTSKEAIIKLIGSGLHYPLQDFSVQLRSIEMDENYNFEAVFKENNSKAFVEVFRTVDNLFGAIATKDKLDKIIYCLFDEKKYPIEKFLADYL